MFENLSINPDLRPSDPRFGSGPSLIPVEFLSRLEATGVELLGTSHRQPAVKNLVGEVVQGLRDYFCLPADFTVVFGNGGATHLFDMIGLGLVKKKSVHYTCGEFSEKWYKAHANIPWIAAEQVKSEYGQGCEPTEHEDADMLCITLNETSTAVQLENKVPTLSNQSTLIAVDATSGGGQIPWKIAETDLFFFSPQKVFASEGGLWVAILSPKAKERALKLAQDKSRFVPFMMNWELAITNSIKNQTYNTPSVTSFFFLNEQIKLMNNLGFAQVQGMAQDKANLIYGWAEEKEYLSPFVQESRFRSLSVATIDVDEKYPVDDLAQALSEQKIAYDIGGYRKLGRNQLRLSLFHNVTYENLEKLTKIISQAIEENS